MPIIDADAHVVETEATWDFMDQEDQEFRPTLVSKDGDPKKAFWMVEGKRRRGAHFGVTSEDLQATSKRIGRNVVTPEEARTGLDVESRLRHMDSLGIDVQVLYSTIFIEEVAATAKGEIAICKSWNRWLSQIWKQSEGRLRWACELPLKTIEAALDELRFSQENGACAVFMRPVEGDRLMMDPYFYPVYEEASRLNLAMGVHISNGNAAIVDVMRAPYDPGNGLFSLRGPTVTACHSLIVSEIPQVFPNLRWGFVETSAQWIPWVYKEAANRFRSRGKTLPPDVFKQYNIYVTCETEDDLPYILQYSGEDNIVIGTDYGHQDPSSNLDAISKFVRETTLEPRIVQKILDANPRALYGLS